jgi:uncharacterized membrane protein YecN with MAPEG domain
MNYLATAALTLSANIIKDRSKYRTAFIISGSNSDQQQIIEGCPQGEAICFPSST